MGELMMQIDDDVLEGMLDEAERRDVQFFDLIEQALREWLADQQSQCQVGQGEWRQVHDPFATDAPGVWPDSRTDG